MGLPGRPASAFAGLQRRETGIVPGPRGVRMRPDFLWASLSSASLSYEDAPGAMSDQRGCFDVGFSEDGALVVGCMEDSSVRLIDSRQGGTANRQRCVAMLRSHLDAVNHHKFMDDRRILTTSDDSTVLLWDLRCLGSGDSGREAGRATPSTADRACVDRFMGHDNWVKNVELISRTHFLSSDLSGDVRLWDMTRDGINQTVDIFNRERSNVIFQHRGLCRMTLVQDSPAPKLVVSLRDRPSSADAPRRGRLRPPSPTHRVLVLVHREQVEPPYFYATNRLFLHVSMKPCRKSFPDKC